MFNQDPRWLIPAVYLASDRLFYHQLQQHRAKGTSSVAPKEEEKKVIALAAKDYQFYFGGRLRKEDIESNAEYWSEHLEKIGSLGILQQLSDDFLLWQGDCFEVRRERMEAWIMLCSVVDPAWIIASAYAKLFKQKVLSENELIATFVGRQCPFAFPNERNNNEFADNHIHFNGHGYSSLSMLSFLDDNTKLKEDMTWPYREEYTLCESGLIEKSQLDNYFSSYISCLLPSIYPKIANMGNITDSSMRLDYDSLNDHSTSSKATLSKLIRQNYCEPANIQQSLLYVAMQQDTRTHQRWMLLCCGLIIENEDPTYHSCLSNLIRASNILRNYMVVSAVGLGQFVEYFRSPARIFDKETFDQEATSYDFNPNISREYRVSPGMILSNKQSEKIYHYGLKDFYSSHEKQHKSEQAHLVVHFSRSFPKEKKKQTYHKMQDKLRRNLLKQIRKLEQFHTSATMEATPYSHDDTDDIHHIDLRKLIRGYDVAGNENEFPIEVFAPVLRVLRAAKYSGGGAMTTRLQRPFITVHSGEDYSHLLSGLRAIDEAVEFCQLREGDRLGHGLALGIDVNFWAKRQKRAYLTAGQHLDNLVWAYYQAVQLSQYTVEHIPIMHELRDKIHHWSQLLYKEICTPNQLYKAWLLRRNWPDYNDMHPEVANYSEWVPDSKLLESEEQHERNTLNSKEYTEKTSAKQLWERYLNSEIEENEAFNRIISINCQPDIGESFFASPNENEDVISLGEIRLYEAIQDFMMEKYSRRGLVIEACPTSNIYIGRFEKYHEHPIFRWNPPHPDWLKPGEKFNRYGLRSGPLTVCVNTDDSALMPTTIANEHRIIRETAIQCYGIGTLMADVWINSIRQTGVDIFKTNHLSQR